MSHWKEFFWFFFFWKKNGKKYKNCDRRWWIRRKDLSFILFDCKDIYVRTRRICSHGVRQLFPSRQLQWRKVLAGVLGHCRFIHFQINWLKLYREFHRFGQAKFPDEGLILGSSQFSILPQLPQKNIAQFESGQNQSKKKI